MKKRLRVLLGFNLGMLALFMLSGPIAKAQVTSTPPGGVSNFKCAVVTCIGCNYDHDGCNGGGNDIACCSNPTAFLGCYHTYNGTDTCVIDGVSKVTCTGCNGIASAGFNTPCDPATCNNGSHTCDPNKCKLPDSP